MKRKIIIAGGSGLLGRNATDYFLNQGDEVVILSRNRNFTYKNAMISWWDGKNEAGWSMCLENADALINFSGKSIQCVHTEENLKQILETRTDSINALSQAIESCDNPPKVFIQAGATAIFGNHYNINDESSTYGSDHLAKLCQKWEDSFNKIKLHTTRKVLLRIGIILSKEGGALAPLKTLSKYYLGGKAGDGRQYISWAHQDDFNAIMETSIENEMMEGSFNACSPYPISNRDFMSSLRRVLKRGFGIPAPAIAIKIAGRYLIKTDPSLILNSNRTISKKLNELGFKFSYPELGSALKDLC